MRMADEFAQRGVDVTVLTSTRAVAQHNTYKLLPIIENWSWMDILACRKLLQESAPDVVDIHFTGWIYNDHPMITFLPTLIKRLLPQTHVCVHIESLGGIRRDLSTIGDIVIRRIVTQFIDREQINYEYGSLIRDADSVVFLSERDKYELSKTFTGLADKSKVLPPPPIMPVLPALDRSAVQEVRRELGAEDSEIVLAYYGYVYPGKGVETLLSAIRHLVEKNRQVALIVIGGSPEMRVLDQRCQKPNYIEELESSTSALAIKDRVRWIGYSPANSERPSKLLRACDICVLPFDSGVMLHNSSFAFAAMHGVPIITTTGPDTDAVFVHRDNVIVIRPSHSLDLSAAIIELFDDRALQEKISAGALKLAKQKFSWETTLKETMNVWRM